MIGLNPGDQFVRRSMNLAVQTSGSPVALTEAVRREIWSLNANLPIAGIRTMDQILSDSIARTSFTLFMLAVAAAMALFLGSIGIYGVISYAVSQRTREIGIRIALGARRADVSRMVVRQGMFMVVVGVASGIIGALGLTRLMEALLFEVSPTDPLIFGLVTLVLCTVAVLACYLPARRAAGVAPSEALRAE